MRLGKRSKILIAVLCSELAGGIGSIFSIPAIPIWYNLLNKPFFNPPNWVFGPVWTLLYLLMGIAAGLIWSSSKKKSDLNGALLIFDVQLALNILWSFLFFGLRSTFYGLIGIIVLWISILATIIKFYRISKAAALMLVPYLLWSSFALLLNLYVWRLN